jgi:peptidoglycan/xylan/chitin deacetylase (PgdA/CDA1 family)
MPEHLRKRVLRSIDRAGLAFSREAMTVDDIKSIAVMPLVTLGAHTVTHPNLPNCAENELEYELAESKRRLEDWTGKPVTTFAYPSGSFDGRERRFLEKYGYEIAATIKNGHTGPDSDRYLIPRSGVMDDGSFIENLCHALGVWEPVVNKLKRCLPQY